MASPGPMPRTRSSSPVLPKGPSESRSATIRAASAGPTPLSVSISAADAMSISMIAGMTGSSGVAGVPASADADEWAGLVRRPLPFFLPFFFLATCCRAESTASIWASSARRAAASGGLSLRRTAAPRAPAPSTTTAPRKRRAFRSPGVGISHRTELTLESRHQIVSRRTDFVPREKTAHAGSWSFAAGAC